MGEAKQAEVEKKMSDMLLALQPKSEATPLLDDDYENYQEPEEPNPIISMETNNVINFLEKIYSQTHQENLSKKIIQVQSYGCWCRRFNELLQPLGGLHLSDLDLACKELSQCRRCNTLNPDKNGDHCGNDKATDSNYLAEFNSDTGEFSCSNADSTDTCAQNRCSCDMMAAEKIHKELMKFEQEHDSHHIGSNLYKTAEECTIGSVQSIAAPLVLQPMAVAPAAPALALQPIGLVPMTKINGPAALDLALAEEPVEPAESIILPDTKMKVEQLLDVNFQNPFMPIPILNEKCCGSFPTVSIYDSSVQGCVGDEVVDLQMNAFE